MAAIEVENSLRVGLFGRTAGQAQGCFKCALFALLVNHFAFDHEDLADVREVEIRVEGAAAPNPSRFDAAMVGC